MSAPVLVGPSPQGGGPTGVTEWDEILADFGDRVRAERKARGWTEAVLAEQADVDRATVRRIQRGIGSLRVFVQICAGLGVDMDYLLSDRWVPPAPDPCPRLLRSQVRVLRAAASGEPLAQVASQLGMARPAVSSHLTRIYEALGVSHLPRDQRRSAAARVAMQHGLFDPANRTS